MLCRIACSFPSFVEDFLDLSVGLSRRFREETVTDMLMSNLVLAGRRSVIVDFPYEPTTGADMEWNFVNIANRTFCRILVQAKRSYGTGNKWSRHAYRELYHSVGSPRRMQAEILCSEARKATVPTFPLYMFYTPGVTCRSARASGEKRVAGVTISDGYQIEKLVLGAKSRRDQLLNRRLKTISGHMYPLKRLFCPSTVRPMPPMAFSGGMADEPLYAIGRTFGFAMSPTPSQICERLDDLFGSSPKATDRHADRRLLRIGYEIPEDIEDAIARGKFPAREGWENRYRVLFISNIEE